MSDPPETQLLAMRRALEAFQVGRLRRDFADLMAEPQYRLLGDFFFDELYAPRDFSARSANVHRLYAMLRGVPGVKIAAIERAVRLMDITESLDQQLALLLLGYGATLPLDEQLYEQAYRAAEAYAQREEQLQLIVATLHDVHGLARVPLMGWHMRQIQPLADSLGFGSLARFLVTSLEAVRPLRDIASFTSILYQREKRRLDRIYT